MAENTGAAVGDVQRARCALDHLVTKWSVLILTVLCAQPARFNEIMRRLDGITHKALSDALKRLERNGLIRRRVLPTTLVGVEYRITELGLSVQEPVNALYAWAVRHAAEIEDALPFSVHEIDASAGTFAWRARCRQPREN
ncbi:MAG: winged helix-turn-helix transcriptional regulator [Mycobacterium sp.]